MHKSLLLLLSIAFFAATAQEEQVKATAENHIDVVEQYEFTSIVDIATTPVKDQARSSTCWSFAGVSFLESEVIRTQNLRIDLSEMFVVRMVYLDKAKKYVRMHGEIAFAGGGEAPDVIYVLKNYGALPETVYSGLPDGANKHNHHKLQNALQSYLDGLIAQPEISNTWEDEFNKILDRYLGPLPNTFDFDGVTYSAKSFADNVLKLNADDYVSITSFSHHPFYESFALEVPDNWMWEKSFNLPIDELMSVINRSLTEGYSVAWALDNSEEGFSYLNGLALLPETPWKNMSPQQEESTFAGPHQEMVVTQAWRQDQFNSYQTLDDHGMHIVGMLEDQEGNRFYVAKNSWGNKPNSYRNGYLYASEAYLRGKTISILVNKKSLNRKLTKKLKH